ncbi:MAG: alpha/beta hydrolase fold domain-containing protein [Halomonadaceae bacterium]|uniref:Alpha/beta hydrolase fold domain-containing protein n=1 Tax=Halomonas colorata TaxID=2742615 RepID=A0ABR9FV89_9GAMM|nr:MULTISPECIES: alpha/beta hydrolase [Halomonas]MBE0462557.1 alpha/beta hydrolase fold domain-containing protein [Halomonas colorata]
MLISDFIARFEAGLARLEQASIQDARRHYDDLCQSFAPADPKGMTVADDYVAGVPVRRFCPAVAPPEQIVFIHGGGFTIGSVRSHHGVAASLADQLNREVVSINYRLAPEACYAAMLSDCINVAQVVKPIALVGDSAGGRLAMDMAPLLNKAMSNQPLLGLIYPPVNGLTEQTLGPDGPLLSRQDVVLCLLPLCPALNSPCLTPAPASQVEVLAVEHDPLTLPLETTVARWRAEGVQVGYHHAAAMVHGSLHGHAMLPEMQNAWQDFCQALRSRLPR